MALRAVRHVGLGLALALALLVAGLAAGCGESRIEAYCSYGSISEAQLEGCMEHVTDADIESRTTNAAEYARGDLDECLYDAGPFCQPR